MGYGVEVYNEAGQIQIDSDMRNVVFDRKITSFSWGGAWTYGGSGSFKYVWNANTNIASDEILAIHSPNHYVGQIVQLGPGYTYTMQFLVVNTATNTAPTGVIGYVFKDKAVAPAPDNCGIECYNASGVLTFAPTMKLMRITHLGSTPTLSAGALPSPTTISTDSGKAPYAVVLNRPRMGLAFTGTPGATEGDAVVDGVMTPAAGTSVAINPCVFAGYDSGAVWPNAYTPYNFGSNMGVGGTVFIVRVGGL